MLDAVKIVNGKAVTTSRKVAEVFEKQHKHVLETIRNLEIPETYRETNFRQTVYEQPNPSGGKPIQHPEYLITRDGFTILAMGFTGKKAMEFKIAYINAFNAMEEQLQTRQLPAASNPRSTLALQESTITLLDTINRQILAGAKLDKEILQYARSVSHVIGRRITHQVQMFDAAMVDFINNIAPGQYSRAEVYDAYCQCCNCHTTPRWFWSRARQIRPCTDIKNSKGRFVVYE
jgi:Rha family phage regulatory protein